ncbi:MAG: hypothetical protein IJ934_05205 [Acetobacter sp.]|nr:hypothetical protein [Acetobacter sp.]
MIGRLVLRALVGGGAAWQCEVQQGVQVASLCVGQTPEQAVKILSRVFALCRAAHSVAARQALGLPCVHGEQQEQILEILRDHVMAFYVHFPKFFGLQPDRLLVQRINKGRLIGRYLRGRCVFSRHEFYGFNVLVERVTKGKCPVIAPFLSVFTSENTSYMGTD